MTAIDIAEPSPLPDDVREHLNFVLSVPLDADTSRQEFCLRFPTASTTLYAFVALRWCADPTAQGEHLQVRIRAGCD